MATTVGTPDLDVDLMYRALRVPVTAGPLLRASKWRGGLWVTYIDSTEGDFVVEASDGNSSAGFLLYASENYALTPPTEREQAQT